MYTFLPLPECIFCDVKLILPSSFLRNDVLVQEEIVDTLLSLEKFLAQTIQMAAAGQALPDAVDRCIRSVSGTGQHFSPLSSVHPALSVQYCCWSQAHNYLI